jgi:hypothetical protein
MLSIKIKMNETIGAIGIPFAISIVPEPMGNVKMKRL